LLSDLVMVRQYLEHRRRRGEYRLPGFVTTVTGQCIEWVGEFRQDILATAND
jgi:hypothetical protein